MVPYQNVHLFNISIAILDFLIGSWLFFCIASHIVICLPTIATTIVVLKGDSEKEEKSFCYRFHRATKSDTYHNSWKSDKFIESNQEKKQRTDTTNEAKKGGITLQGAIQKRPILLS